MTIKDFFYIEAGQTRRVEAESFTQVTSGDGGGQCEGVQYVLKTVVRLRWDPTTFGASDVFTTTEYTSFPFGGVGGYYDLPSIIYGGGGRNSLGWEAPPLLKRSPSGGTRANFRRPRVQLPSARSYGRQVMSLISESYTRTDGLPDDCGESTCTTEFFRGGQVIHTLGTCPEISEGQPPGCDCCSELLPLLRAINV